MSNDIPTVHHKDVTNSFEPRSLNQDIPLIDENIPKECNKKNILHFIFVIFFVTFFINGFLYIDMYRKVFDLKSSVDIIQSEQMSRTSRVYDLQEKNMLKSDFNAWLSDFRRLNEEIDVPKI